MAVFKQELNWSTYQDKQLKILESLDRSFTNSLRIGQHLSDTMNKVEYAITSIAYASEASAKNVAAMTKDLIGHSTEFIGRMDKAGSSVQEFKINIDSSSRSIETFSRNVESAGDMLTRSIKSICRYLGGAEGIGKNIDNFSTASNQMIRLSGMSGDVVREFRGEIMSIVADLNLSTGSAFNPTESYKQVVSIAQGITGNLEAIEEMTRPLLLTQETLDVNMNTVADIFNKFYTRYSFSSIHMESALDEIRGNTAGNSADAEATMRNIQSLENMIGYVAGNNNDLREQMMESISHYTSWFESMGVDSAPFTEYLNAIAYGDYSQNPELANILSRAGFTSTAAATEYFRSGDPQVVEKLAEALYNGVYSVMSTYDTSLSLGASLDNTNINRDLGMNIFNSKNSENFMTLEEFLAKPSTPSSIELAEDRYISAADKTNNWLEQIYGLLARLQEINPLGFGFSDAALAYALFGRGRVGNAGSINLLGSLRGIGVNSAIKGMITTNGYSAPLLSMSDGLGKVAALGGGIGGTAMLAGGLTAGAALGIDGISGVMDSSKTTGYRVGSGIEAAAGIGGAAALIGLGLTNPIGWIALAVGGLSYLGKSAYENAHELSGNAKVVEQQLGDIGDSLRRENDQRLANISDLRYQFTQETDIEKQRQLLEESGLFNKEDLQNKEEAQLLALIDSYKDSVSALGKVTEEALGYADRFYKEKQNKQQKDFIGDLKNANLSESQMTDVIRLLQTSVTDEDLLEKFKKALKDDKITKSEFNDLLYGGKNSWFDKNNLEDKSLDVLGMQRVSGYLGWGKSYTTTDNMENVVRLYNKFADPTNSDEDRAAAWKSIVDSGLEEEVRNVYGEQLKVYGYSDGSNYITKDQLALIHEGEAIIPKKYNPAVNNATMRELLNYINNSQSESARKSDESKDYFLDFLRELKDIKEFLEDWKSDNNIRSTTNSVMNRHLGSTYILQKYFNTGIG